jgi:hypothetical protein
MAHIPFKERPTCTINEACQATGFCRSRIYRDLGAGLIQSIQIEAPRFILVPSLLARLDPSSASEAT